MRVTIKTTELRSALSVASRFVARRDAKPILQCLLLTANNGGLDIVGQDMEKYAGVTVPDADVQVHGRCAVPSSRLCAAVGFCTDEATAIEADEKSCRVASGRFEVKISCFDADLFPVSDLMHDADGAEVDGDALALAITRVLPCCNESLDFMTSGVCFECDGKTLTCVATNQRSLASQVVGPFSKKIDRIKVSMDALQSITGGILPQARLAVSKNTLIILAGGSRFSARLFNGKFVDWMRAIPAIKHSISLPVGSLRNGIKSSMICMERETQWLSGSTIVEVEDGLLRVHAEQSQFGVSACEIPVDGTHAPVRIFFSPEYLLKAIAGISAESVVEFGYSDGNTAVTIKTDDGFLGVVACKSTDR